MDGKLVRLRALEMSDVDNVMKWVNDEEVIRFLGPQIQLPTSRVQEEEWIRKRAAASPTTCFAIETLAGEYLGGIDFHGIEWVDRRAEVGIVIGIKSHWGKGYGTDAMRVLLRMAFAKLNLHRITLRVFDFNQRAIQSYEKCGFRREGVLRDDVWRDGRYCNTIVMGILEPEYRALAAKA